MSAKRTHSDDQVMMTEDCHSSKRIKFGDNDYFTMNDDTTISEVYDKILSILKKDGTVSEYTKLTGLNDVSEYVYFYRPSVVHLDAFVYGCHVDLRYRKN